MTECMHDVANHIENLLQELPYHVSERDKEKIEIILDLYYNEKDQKRCCDKRKILLTLTLGLNGHINGDVHRLLLTLSEVQRILYLSDEHRTPREVLNYTILLLNISII